MVIVMLGDKCPIGNHTRNADGIATVWGGPSNQVLDTSGVEELDVRESQDLGKNGGCEKSSVLDNDEVGASRVLFVRNANLSKESISWLADDHGGEELASKPATAT